MSDLIFVSLENWDQIWRRNQFLVAEMARRDPGRTILFVGPSRDVSYGVRTRRLPFGSDGARVRPPFDTIRLFRPLKLLPYTLALGRGANQILERAQVRRAARRLELARPILWLNPHQAHHYAGRLGESCVVYDITDDWISLTQKSWLRELTRWQDEQLCRKADAVIVCSEKLYKMKQNLSTNLHLIPNGVDAAHYASVLQSGPLPAPAQVWRKPVLGYTGTLHPDRVDVELIDALARRFHDGTVALVGPNMLPVDQTKRLLTCGNVEFTGAVPYDELPGYMRAFDVCITPHKVTPFTESLNPIKLWEYLAAGKPIVSTDVAGFRDYADLAHIARDAESFLDAVKAALSEDGSLVKARQAVAAEHSWVRRVDAVEQVIDACLARRKAAHAA